MISDKCRGSHVSGAMPAAALRICECTYEAHCLNFMLFDPRERVEHHGSRVSFTCGILSVCWPTMKCYQGTSTASLQQSKLRRDWFALHLWNMHGEFPLRFWSVRNCIIVMPLGFEKGQPQFDRKIADWKKKDRVDLHNSTAAQLLLLKMVNTGLSSLSRLTPACQAINIQSSSQLQDSVQMVRTRCLSVVGDFMKVPCHAPRVDEWIGSFLGGMEMAFFWPSEEKKGVRHSLTWVHALLWWFRIRFLFAWFPLARFSFWVPAWESFWFQFWASSCLIWLLTFRREGVAPDARAFEFQVMICFIWMLFWFLDEAFYWPGNRSDPKFRTDVMTVNFWPAEVTGVNFAFCVCNALPGDVQSLHSLRPVDASLVFRKLAACWPEDRPDSKVCGDYLIMAVFVVRFLPGVCENPCSVAHTFNNKIMVINNNHHHHHQRQFDRTRQFQWFWDLKHRIVVPEVYPPYPTM